MSDQDEYDVEAVLDRRIKNGREEYEINTIGYEQTTWEPRSNLSCSKLLREFLDKINPKATETRKKLKQIGDDEEVASDSNSSSSEEAMITIDCDDSDDSDVDTGKPLSPLTDAKKEFLAKLGMKTVTTKPLTRSSASKSTQHREIIKSSQRSRKSHSISNSDFLLRKPQLRNPTANIQKKTVNGKETVKKLTSAIRRTQLEEKSKIRDLRNSMNTRFTTTASTSYHNNDNTKDDIIKKKLWSLKIPKKTPNEIKMSDLFSELNQNQDQASTSSNTLKEKVIKSSNQKKEKSDRYIAQIEIESLNIPDEKLFATLESEDEVYMDYIIAESYVIDFLKTRCISKTILHIMTSLSNNYQFEAEIEKLKLGNMAGIIYLPRIEPDDVVIVCAPSSNLCTELNEQFTWEKKAVIFRMPFRRFSEEMSK
ncbi:5618_t:CDS:2 [Ambispora gerdemannii]|uniref:5618_t:CDS:1 n=1 Tax=Ambispora gerdemannii TaxID=144530 RepID=A0A9N9A578_9GLOM|nr:5618_t:CDS:2 [Ambispora gerdemannii]